MIKVYFKEIDENVVLLKVLGHADYSKSGNLDLVCACVSSIVIGGLNQINDIQNYKSSVNSGDVEVVVDKANIKDDAVLRTIITQLSTLSTKYQKNIKIEKE